uniref:Cell division cycle protein 27 homolog n=1 Tax=Mus spicilegus TaxID=10103 RepID=A0A8C6GDP9_MUSSI
MTVLQEPVQAAIWQALNHYAYCDAVFLAERLYAEKGNRSYLVECLISRKAMTTLSLSLVIQLASLFPCWDMCIARQIGLPKGQNVTKRALV